MKKRKFLFTILTTTLLLTNVLSVSASDYISEYQECMKQEQIETLFDM
ncbi:MAG: hypothetical protein IJX63_03690 [Lachnospiraceae bacterium]|nr:hypothetical protein [Lachnospiraceae bacterium]